MKLNIQNCQRCGDVHKAVEFKELSRPNAGFQYWAPCPTNGEPILLNVGGGDQGLRTVMHVSHVDVADRFRAIIDDDSRTEGERLRDVREQLG